MDSYISLKILLPERQIHYTIYSYSGSADNNCAGTSALVFMHVTVAGSVIEFDF